MVGQSIEEAFCRLELFERVARISLGLQSVSPSPSAMSVSFSSSQAILPKTHPKTSLHSSCEKDAVELHTFASRAYSQVSWRIGEITRRKLLYVSIHFQNDLRKMFLSSHFLLL